jgi:plasmid stability protein
MSSITIKDIPPAVHRALKLRAKASGRSLNSEIITMLEQVVSGARVDASAVGRHAQAVRESMGVYLTGRDLEALKKSGRK